ncbi:MAG: hypothetical protein FWH11_03270 [Micrococcales bacterium]|nr:hypothetical protein [Micrococcales bacterium]
MTTNLPNGYGSQFDMLAGQLRRVIIDLYMISNYAIEEIWDDYYVAKGQKAQWSRPGPDGYGGGTYDQGYMSPGEVLGDHLSGGADCSGNFDSIRNSVRSVIEPWRDIPAPDSPGLHAATKRADACVNRFMHKGPIGGPPIPDGPPGTGDEGNMAATLQTIWDELHGSEVYNPRDPASKPPALEGTTALVFEQYIRNIDAAIIVFHQIATVLQASLKAQETLWKTARGCVIKILQHFVRECDRAVSTHFANRASAEKRAASLELTVCLSVIGVAPSTPLVVGTTVTNLGLFVASYVGADPPRGGVQTDSYDIKVPHVSNYANAMSELYGAFGTDDDSFVAAASLPMRRFVPSVWNDLNATVTAAETRINQDLINCLQEVTANRGIVDLVPDPIELSEIDSYNKFHRRIGVNTGRTDRVARLLTALSHQIGMIGADANDTRLAGGYPDSMVRRSCLIGIGADGPAEQFDALAYLLYILADELGWEVDRAERNFSAAVAVLDDANTAAKDTLQRLAAEYGLGYEQGGAVVGVDSYPFDRYEK